MAVYKIKLTQGKVALVDKEDFDKLSTSSWFCNGGYAAAKINSKTIKMHRLILQAKCGEIVDHINQNKLDNRKSNLRLASASLNKANMSKRIDNKSGYKGVFQKTGDKYRKKNWAAVIGFGGHHFHIGYYYSPEEAAKAYNNKAKELFGEFASLNSLRKVG